MIAPQEALRQANSETWEVEWRWSGDGEEGHGELFMGAQFQFGMMGSPGMDGEGCTTRSMPLMPLNCTLINS